VFKAASIARVGSWRVIPLRRRLIVLIFLQ
jgi:hypothetical protein